MTVLLRSERGPPGPDVLVLGGGAIGSAVVSRLRRLRDFAADRVVVPWEDPDGRRATFADIDQALRPRVTQRPFSVVWAAGKAGFAATEPDAAAELAAYRDVLDFFGRLQARGPEPAHAFHLVSSAGGLYEGQAVRSRSQPPAPSRPYGHLKLAQERLARAALPDVHVYRPSSVYSPPARGGRPGLVGVLVGNGIAQRPTRIVGALHTLRDYVMAGDVGAYVADRVLAPQAPAAEALLVSGHPASILQVVATVEEVIRRRLYVRIAEAWNAQNITFSPAVRAGGFASRPLAIGVRMVHATALGRPAQA